MNCNGSGVVNVPDTGADPDLMDGIVFANPALRKNLHQGRGAVQFAPKAIMNAVYVFEDREIRGTDNASFRHIWANKH
jgi:hypothetical protein